jgi:hypothetical protein
MYLISRLKDLVVYLIGIVVGTQFLNSRLSMGLNRSYDHMMMHRLSCYLGMDPQVNEQEVMELDKMLSHSTRN